MSSWNEHPYSDWLHRAGMRCAAVDLLCAIRVHRAANRRATVVALTCISLLGDGPIWCAFLVLLPMLNGWQAWPCVLQMVSAGALNLAVYFSLKHGTGRPRPFAACPDIRACTRALDRFSFPSGHTLHAVTNAILISHHYPSLAASLWSFAALVAISRVALGLHYPSDVLAGSLIGVSVGGAVLAWP